MKQGHIVCGKGLRQACDMKLQFWLPMEYFGEE